MRQEYQQQLYTFHTDLFIEKPYFQRMVNKLDGKLDKYQVNNQDAYNCKCPTCGNPAAKLCLLKNNNTYGLICPNSTCSRRGIKLHDLIQDYGGKVMFNEWRNSRWEKRLPHGWKGIKNRKTKTQTL